MPGSINRVKWLRDGDSDLKFFHSLLGLHESYMLCSIEIDIWIEATVESYHGLLRSLFSADEGPPAFLQQMGSFRDLSNLTGVLMLSSPLTLLSCGLSTWTNPISILVLVSLTSVEPRFWRTLVSKLGHFLSFISGYPLKPLSVFYTYADQILEQLAYVERRALSWRSVMFGNLNPLHYVMLDRPHRGGCILPLRGDLDQGFTRYVWKTFIPRLVRSYAASPVDSLDGVLIRRVSPWPQNEFVGMEASLKLESSIYGLRSYSSRLSVIWLPEEIWLKDYLDGAVTVADGGSVGTVTLGIHQRVSLEIWWDHLHGFGVTYVINLLMRRGGKYGYGSLSKMRFQLRVDGGGSSRFLYPAF
ncbi:hypothetical protein FNV43_RR01218 [Rhamnella rubrinervis]|uniref:Uncharacterized protein n=1 Tax=Rhamnella rubrinervis TaxID=2594499 RepID=A0A8K0HQJ6_9ROSA|nr:hypothetical protein FNV43_RR01218 [Rhamnella rubrinervis]